MAVRARIEVGPVVDRVVRGGLGGKEGSQAPAMADLNRVFGTSSGFETHIRSLLELRFAQINHRSRLEQIDAALAAVGLRLDVVGVAETVSPAAVATGGAETPYV